MITTPSQQVTQQTRTQTMLPLLALCLGYFMTTLDVTIVNIVLCEPFCGSKLQNHSFAALACRIL